MYSDNVGKIRAAIEIIILLAAAFGGASPLATTARADDRQLYSADELAAIESHAQLIRPPADPTNKIADDPRAATLGQFLFFDRRLSSRMRFSCASCHQPERGFTDGRKVAEAIDIGSRNTPTLLNAADNQWFFWDGRADTMWAQALQVIENPREIGGDRLAVSHAIASDPGLRQAYEEIFGPLPPMSDLSRFPAHGTPTANKNSTLARAWSRMAEADKDAVNRAFSNVGKAIAAYERHLLSASSPFDRYAHALRSGDVAGQTLLSPAAKRGLKLFVGSGRCELCHSGPNFSDGQFHNVGLPVLKGERTDDGRQSGLGYLIGNPFNSAGRYSDQPSGQLAQRLKFLPAPKSMRGAFKTPTLRNIALTAPYFHDGRFASLEQVVRFYADGKAADKDQLVGLREGTLDLIPHFTAEEKADLVAFLKTLSSPSLSQTLTEKPLKP